MDAITGEGIWLGLRQASALAEAMVAGNLQQYEKQHRELAMLVGHGSPHDILFTGRQLGWRLLTAKGGLCARFKRGGLALES